MSKRLHWWANLLPRAKSEDGEPETTAESRHVVPEAEANLIGSLTENGTHMPVIDIDRIPVRLVPSSTPGNFHLYIDKEMPWDKYADLLFALADVGIIEPGYYGASVEREGTFVRKPGVVKELAAAKL